MTFLKISPRHLVSISTLSGLLILSGCADAPTPPAEQSGATGGAAGTTDPTTSSATTEPAPAAPAFTPIQIGAVGSGANASTTDSASASAELTVQQIINQLKPLQVLMGKWRGTTRQEYDGFKAVDEHEWIWDLKSKSGQPALVADSDNSPYFRNARMTYTKAGFELTTTDKGGATQTFHGEYIQEPTDVPGDDNKLQRVFKLEFTQVDPPDANPAYQFLFNQQENNRYLLEVSKRRGKATFRRFDTVSTQREGTSFALSDTDYGEKTCIISEGLGTTMVSHKGKSYWVCCSGCKAAFEDDPEKWIALAAEREKEKAMESN